jgi:hypothetical protein
VVAIPPSASNNVHKKKNKQTKKKESFQGFEGLEFNSACAFLPSTSLIMLTTAHMLAVRRVRSPQATSQAGVSRRSYTSRGNPKSRNSSQMNEVKYLAYMQGIVAPRDVLPEDASKPLPRKFNASGFLGVTAAEVTQQASNKVTPTKKKSKNELPLELKRAKTLEERYTDGSAEDAQRRYEIAKRDMFGHTAGAKVHSTHEEAQFATQQLINKQKLAKDSREDLGDLSVSRDSLVYDPWVDKSKDDELVDDPELQKRWKEKVKSVKQKVSVIKSKSKKPSSKLVSSSNNPKSKVSSSSKKKKSSKKSSSSSILHEELEKAFRKEELAARAQGRTLFQEEANDGVASTKEPPPLTYMEGSTEDLATFVDDQFTVSEDHPMMKRMNGVDDVGDILGGESGGSGGSGSSSRISRPRLHRKRAPHIASMDDLDPDAYLASVQKQDDRAAKQYVDTYDHDTCSRPPTPTYQYAGIFKDEIGTSKAIVDSMGTWLSLKSRGIRFEGTDSLNWLVRDYLLSQEIADLKFKFHQPPTGKTDVETSHIGKIPVLDKFKLDFVIPVKYATAQANDQSIMEEAKIHVTSQHNEQYDSLAIRLELPSGEIIHPDSPSIDVYGLPTSFDEQIKQIQQKLPAKSFLKTCWSCALSEYSPLTKSTSFGSLACFRQWPGIQKVRDKIELLRNWNKHLEKVQETHLCESFTRRTKPRIVGFNPVPMSNQAGIKVRKAELEQKKASAAKSSENPL